MRIKEIELDNFKSFGEKTVLPILDGFTTVSGPNGSGKSNVIDSLMFALGLTTTRNMRAEKLSDLLNNISGKKECSVRVTFKDEDSGVEIIIQRRIRVKGDTYDSKYSLNDSPATLTQIHDKLADFNISPKGFNVVMQGDVASIISMSPVDRRKIIDEIAGVAEFDRKIEMSAKELAIVYERIESQEIILTELKSRLEQLRKDRDQAVKYAELKKQRADLERKFLGIRKKQVEKQYLDSLNLINDLDLQKVSLRDENIEVNLKIQNNQEDLEALNQEIEKLGEGKQRELGARKEQLQSTLTREESTLEFLEKQINDYETETKNITREIKSLKDKIKDFTFKAEEFKSEKQNIETNIEAEQKNYERIQNEIKNISLNNDVSNKSLADVQNKISEIKEEKSKLDQEKARLEEQKKSHTERIEFHKEEAAKALNEIQNIESSQNGSSNLNLDALKEQIAFQSRSIQALKDEQRDTQEEIYKQQDKLKKIEKQLNQIEGQELAANAAGYGKAVEAVLNIDGVHGTLAQLGVVEDEYKMALETSAGARLRSVVVDDDYVGQDCINFLRQNNLGRATFLPLNKLSAAQDLPTPTMPGIINWAINLVSFKDEYKDAFAYAFSNTLVVKNIEIARKLIGRYRMVTLDGDIVERSGAMSGGSALKSSVHFGANSAHEKQKLENSRIDLQNFITQLGQEHKDLEKQIEEARLKVESLRADYSEKSASSNINSVQLENNKNRYEKEKSSLTKFATELNEIELKIETIDKSISAEETKIELLNKSMEEIADVLKDTGLGALMEESREIEVEIKRYQTMLSNLLNEENRLEIEQKYNEENILKSSLRLETANSELEKLKTEVPLHQANKEKLFKEISIIQSEIDSIKLSIADLSEKRKVFSDELLRLTQRKGEITSLIESTAIKLVESRKKSTEIKLHLEQLEAEWQAQMDSQTEENIPEELSEEDLQALQKQLNKIERDMTAMEPINMRAIEEYEEVKSRETEIENKQQSLAEERTMLINKADSYNEQKLTAFKANFEEINGYFMDIFANLSFGQGQLILEDPEDIFKGGLIIKAQPRGKKMQRLEAMSGGEKSLTALSFLFALQQCNPAPFYAFDEVDSALDGVNVDRLAEKIQSNAKDTQFLVVSHRRPMLEKSDRAIGVSLNKKGFSTVIGMQNIQKEEKELVA
ncbi:MAG: chromosome segregation protein SMC [Proteobacteria bacterium]|nr:chromosome segregation protein SMC [Pseudomonadota bacterium]